MPCIREKTDAPTIKQLTERDNHQAQTQEPPDADRFNCHYYNFYLLRNVRDYYETE